jgi:hypothetical protein
MSRPAGRFACDCGGDGFAIERVRSATGGEIGNSAPGGRRISNPALAPRAIWEMSLEPGDERSHVVVKSTLAVLVQLHIHLGKTIHEATVFPTASC